jgi:radical SAM superfamily enzyme
MSHSEEDLFGLSGGEHQSISEFRDKIKVRYEENIDVVTVGASIYCPYCKDHFKKKTKGHQFCQRACKDKFWNLVNPRGLVGEKMQKILDESEDVDLPDPESY